MVFLFTMVFVSEGFAQGYAGGIESLRGIKGVYVQVGSLKPDIEKDGLRIENIQTDVELKLRLAGIKVLTGEERIKEPGTPFLYVNVSSIKSELGIYTFSINIQLRQLVFLARDLDTRIFACTWIKGIIGTIGANNVVDIRDYVKDNVDTFINDYLSVNPK